MPKLSRALHAAVFGIALGFTGAAFVVPSVYAVEEVNIKDGLAVQGYDVVAYFANGQPTPGNSSFTAQYGGATYRFATAANRDAFASSPTKYAPQFGGYCALGTAMGMKLDGDPKLWRIVDGKLYLNVNADAQKTWITNIPGYLRGANNNWPLIKKLPAASLQSNAPAGLTRGPQ